MYTQDVIGFKTSEILNWEEKPLFSSLMWAIFFTIDAKIGYFY